MPLVRLAGLIAVLAPVVSLACGGSSAPPSPAPNAPVAQEPPTTRAQQTQEARSGVSADASAGTVAGTVAETMNSGGYTYARLEGEGAEKWIAAPETLSLEIGDPVTAIVSMPMELFRSRTLNREFDIIYFVSSVSRNGKVLAPVPAAERGLTMAGSHGNAEREPAPPVEPVAPAPGGLSVADVWAKRESLLGSTVLVRGRVVKANYEIMGVNWYHLQDGSGTEHNQTHDLTVTSDAQARVGDVVTISGTLVTGKDFGAGYAYEAMVEKASIRK